MIEIVHLEPETAGPYQPFTYRSYRDWLVRPDADPEGQKLALGARWTGHPVGLLLAHSPARDDPARVLSVFVDGRFRNRGIGTALMQELKAHLHRIKKRACIEYYALNQYEALERVLVKSGWQPPAVYSRFYRCDIFAGMPSPWIRRFKLPARFRVVPWSELRQNELALMNTLQEQDFNDYFMPLQKESIIDRSCSLALKLDEQIVGWSIVDRELTDTLLYRALYIREAYRDQGLGLALAAQSAQRLGRTGATHTVIQILDKNMRMRKVAERLLAPMQPTVTAYKTALLEL
ncbi:Acetyltransferase (GNAT) family protein [Paenibacillus konkukensis]|uniref:Acetyltransferase (GNAT) family protein n=1 Tax=Paenibacillus konkukensis TaxID=2020716 RepID=A0ABY4RLV3_9BACL|nr:GNAT family N-acetyltransferase [Paenibacillus konkukensis]UQZ83118.1 Acetyltransferase (GNAT) family protein [Paenibacillus konkukensis]